MAATKKDTIPDENTGSEATEARPEMVKIKLQRDRNKNSLPQFVGINGDTYLVPRGIWVDVPYPVADILRAKEEQEDRTMELIDQMKTN